MQHFVAVMSDRFAQGWNGDWERLGSLQVHKVLPLRQALYTVYSTDAHFTLGVVVNQEDGSTVSDQVRLNQPALSVLREQGLDVEFSAIAIDVDCPKDADRTGWMDEQYLFIEASGVGGWLYETRGGYRIVWTLETTLNVEDYMVLLAKLRTHLNRFSVYPDELTDWNRLYRLPFVIRDGEAQDLPHSPFSESLPVLDTEPLIDIDVVDAFTLREAKRPIEPTVEGGRDEFLFKAVAARMRNTAWIPEEMYIPVLEAYNEVYCKPPLSDADLRRIAESVKRYEQGDGDELEIVKTDRIQIKNGGLFQATNQAIEALAKSPGVVYCRDGKLVWINRGGSDSEKPPRIEEIPKPALRGLLDSLVEFYAVKKDRSGEFYEQILNCPKDLVDIVDSQNDYKNVDELEELLLCPTIDPDGNTIANQGYYHNIKSLLIPDANVGDINVPDNPTEQDAADALALLNDLIADFPFQSDFHRSTALAAIITPVVRTAIDGPVPLVLIDSPTPGTGKSLLADISSILSTGKPASRMVWTKEDELEKRITALLGNGTRTILIDNADSVIGGASLDAVLTSNYWMGRVLGRSEMVRVRSRAQWMATGNNLQVSGDLARRAIRCYLDPGVENPETRTDFKYPDLLTHAKSSRAKYVSAAITVVKAWLASGQVINKLTPLGSFERWSDTVRSALIWLGMPDPVESQKAIKESDVSVVWGSALSALSDIYPDGEWFSASDVYNAAFLGNRSKGTKESYDALSSAFEELLGASTPTQKSVAWVMKKWKNRVLSGKRLMRSATRDRLRGFTYQVQEVNANRQANIS